MLQTEFEFTLPKGYVDPEGNVHREGTMRLATAIDEVAPLRDMRVQANEAYLTVILLSRVITRLGTLREVNTGVVEKLFAGDFGYLQDFYRRINEDNTEASQVVCPACQHRFDWEVMPPGGVIVYPLDRLYEEMAYVAYHFHWPWHEVMHMDHRERQRWVDEIAAINTRLSGAEEGVS
jgi:hypothetical protein